MSYQLVIAEKPSVARSIAGVIGATKKQDGYMEGNGYLVSWCIGHLVSLADAGAYDPRYKKWAYDDLPILPQEWQYIIPDEKKKQFDILRSLMERPDVDGLVCATDAGREGELIFRFVYQMVGCKRPFKRLWISSMEDTAIREGFANLKPGADYDNLYQSALCRAQADWLVGINATRLFSILYHKTLTVGRVQTPTLKMLVDREAKISDFKKEKYHVVHIAAGGMEAASDRFSSADDAVATKTACAGAQAVCVSVKREKKTEQPPRLYDLTTLQREANRLFGFTAKQTLDYAQQLYEKKLLTYPRTDSQYLTDDMQPAAESIVSGLWPLLPFAAGLDIAPQFGRVLNSKKVSDHHAIIPTMEFVQKGFDGLTEGEKKLLSLPSILIAGGSNFPVRQKEKQNAARDSNMQEWQYIQGLLDKIRSTGMGGIRQDDPQAIPKLEKKLAGLEKAQETMKAVNAYYRKHGTLDGCPHLSPENLENLKADMASSWHYEKKPFQSWELSNNNAEIRRIRQRIDSLTRARETVYVGWEFEGGHVEANREQSRLQVFFEDKPDADARQQLKEHGFRWAPSVGAWQRLLNGNAYYAADRISSIQPLTGEKPTELQRSSIRQQQAQMAQAQAEPEECVYRVHAATRSDSPENLYLLQAYVPQADGTVKIGAVLYAGTEEKCRELLDQLNTGELTQEAVKELYAKEQEQPQEPAPEQEAAPEPETEQEITPEPKTAQDDVADAEPQEKSADKPLTDLQKKAVEIADRYKDLPLQGKIDVIAQAFGCKTGEIRTSPCTGKWRGTSDMSIRFDNGASLFIGNHLTPKAKTVKVQTECVNSALVHFNPEIVQATKEAALPVLLQREAKDNEIAAQKGLKPYTLLNVEFHDGADEQTGGYIGWYYVTLAVDGKICTHLETGLSHDIADGKVSDIPTRADYFTAGALKETDVDYVFNNVGFSSASTLYALPLREDVRERAEQTLAQRSADQPERDTFSIYQVPAGPQGRDFRYRPYEELQAAGLTVDRKNYELIYTAPLDGKTTLEDIYRTFNADDRPAGFRGHSLSVSDVVVVNRGGKEEAHYCDSIGFTPVPEFMQESPIKTAEMSTEQNYNMIDGTLNNAPSMGELEARAKAEEQISLFDVAEAAKAEAQKPKQPRPASKTAQRQKKPSIRAQLKAAKEEQAKKPPQREKSKELEV